MSVAVAEFSEATYDELAGILLAAAERIQGSEPTAKGRAPDEELGPDNNRGATRDAVSR